MFEILKGFEILGFPGSWSLTCQPRNAAGQAGDPQRHQLQAGERCQAPQLRRQNPQLHVVEATTDVQLPQLPAAGDDADGESFSEAALRDVESQVLQRWQRPHYGVYLRDDATAYRV